MQQITITDSSGANVRPSDLTANTSPVNFLSDDYLDADKYPVHTLAREARPYLQKLIRNAAHSPFVMGLKVPKTLQHFVSGVLGRQGLAIEFKATPDNHTPFVSVAPIKPAVDVDGILKAWNDGATVTTRVGRGHSAWCAL